MPKKRMDLIEAMAAANEHATKVMMNTLIPLPKDTTDSERAALYRVVMQELINAWAAGYMAR